jgi:hypothetical protein
LILRDLILSLKICSLLSTPKLFVFSKYSSGVNCRNQIMAKNNNDFYEIASVPKFTDFNASSHDESLGDQWFESAAR